MELHSYHTHRFPPPGEQEKPWNIHAFPPDLATSCERSVNVWCPITTHFKRQKGVSHSFPNLMLRRWKQDTFWMKCGANLVFQKGAYRHLDVEEEEESGRLQNLENVCERDLPPLISTWRGGTQGPERQVILPGEVTASESVWRFCRVRHWYSWSSKDCHLVGVQYALGMRANLVYLSQLGIWGIIHW